MSARLAIFAFIAVTLSLSVPVATYRESLGEDPVFVQRRSALASGFFKKLFKKAVSVVKNIFPGISKIGSTIKAIGSAFSGGGPFISKIGKVASAVGSSGLLPFGFGAIAKGIGAVATAISTPGPLLTKVRSAIPAVTSILPSTGIGGMIKKALPTVGKVLSGYSSGGIGGAISAVAGGSTIGKLAGKLLSGVGGGGAAAGGSSGAAAAGGSTTAAAPPPPTRRPKAALPASGRNVWYGDVFTYAEYMGGGTVTGLEGGMPHGSNFIVNGKWGAIQVAPDGTYRYDCDPARVKAQTAPVSTLKDQFRATITGASATRKDIVIEVQKHYVP